MRTLYSVCMLCVITILALSCSKDDATPQEPETVYAFTLDGVDHEYNEFSTMSVDTTSAIPHIFFRVDDGDDIFTFNFLLELGPGSHDLNWSDGSSFFFADIEKGKFFTLDPVRCRLFVIENDTINNYIEATFSAIGEKPPTTDTIVVTDGLIKLKYD